MTARKVWPRILCLLVWLPFSASLAATAVQPARQQGKVCLFEKPDGKQYRREWVTMTLRRESLKIIGRAIGAHVFRHSLLSYLAKKTGRIKAVAALAGHSSAKTTLDLYVHDHFTFDEQQALLRKRKEGDI